MSVKPTQAASVLSKKGEEVNPHQLISLLMAGMIERVGQAKECIRTNNHADKEIILVKVKAILNGLRASLDFDQGGDIAINLETLYVYMISLLSNADSGREEIDILDEVEELVKDVKVGWDAIEQKVTANVA